MNPNKFNKLTIPEQKHHMFFNDPYLKALREKRNQVIAAATPKILVDVRTKEIIYEYTGESKKLIDQLTELIEIRQKEILE